MRGISKGEQPACLTVRSALIQEQGALCAYCEGRIRESPREPKLQMKIEHWSARHDDAQHGLIFTWSNLLGVCCGESGGDAHCDTYRGRLSTDQQALHINPAQAHNLQSLFRMLGDGRLVSDDERVQADIETLNLNCALLKRNRVAALEQARERAGGYSRGDLERALRRLLVPNARGELTEYLSVFERYYQKKLRVKGVR